MTGAMIRGHRMGSALQTTGLAHVAMHFAVFAVLGLLTMFSFAARRNQFLAVLLGILLGAGTELYEHLAFGSSMEFADVLVDAAGVLLGAGVILFLRLSQFWNAASS
jgi:VanZ family protein